MNKIAAYLTALVVVLSPGTPSMGQGPAPGPSDPNVNNSRSDHQRPEGRQPAQRTAHQHNAQYCQHPQRCDRNHRVRTQRVWVEGHYQRNRFGRRVWVQGRYVERRVHVHVSVSRGRPGCSAGMPRPAFNRAMQQLANARFADTRIRIAQQIIRSNPVTAQQVYEVMTVMHFESSRLRIARFAYRHVVNPNEYYVVNDAFRFESSIRKLDRHLASCTF